MQINRMRCPMGLWRKFVDGLMSELMPTLGTRPHPVRDASWWPL